MKKIFEKITNELKFLSLKNVKNFSILFMKMPLWSENYYSLKRALKSKNFKIVEIKEVNDVVIINELEKPVMILKGQVIVGGAQNRIFLRTTLIPSKEFTKTRVFCVEEGRWSNQWNREPETSDFKKTYIAEESLALFSLIDVENEQNIREQQKKVWREIDEFYAKKAQMTPPSTKDYSYYLQLKSKEMEDVLNNLEFVKEANAIAIFENESLLGLELISDTQAFEDNFRDIICAQIKKLNEDFKPITDNNYYLTVVKNNLKYLFDKSIFHMDSTHFFRNIRYEDSRIWLEGLIHVESSSDSDVDMVDIIQMSLRFKGAIKS